MSIPDPSLADVIPFPKPAIEPPEFAALLDEALNGLQTAADLLVENLVNCAMVTCWKAWDEAQPVGSCLILGNGGVVEALMSCPDARIKRLTIAYSNLLDVIGEFRPSQLPAPDAQT